MIVVTGASGQLGHRVVERLLNHMAARDIAVSVRTPQMVDDLAALGVAVRSGDFADPISLRTAFKDAAQVLIVSVDKLGEEALRLHRSAIEAAREANVGHILYTSHMGARAGSLFIPGDQHAGTEADLAASGVRYTALRHGFYAESCLLMVGDGLRSGDLRTPADGPVSWTTRADLAEADAAILAAAGRWEGSTPPLTAPEALTMAQLAAIASEVTGREVRHTTISDEAWLAEKEAAGMPAMYANMLLGMFKAARRGDFAATDPALPNLLGRAPQSMRAVLTIFLRGTEPKETQR